MGVGVKDVLVGAVDLEAELKVTGGDGVLWGQGVEVWEEDEGPENQENYG